MYVPIKKSAITQKMCIDKIQMIMLLKEKHCGKIKGRMFTNVRKQKNSNTLTAVATDSVLITTNIDASENQYFMVIDFPGAFLTAYID